MSDTIENALAVFEARLTHERHLPRKTAKKITEQLVHYSREAIEVMAQMHRAMMNAVAESDFLKSKLLTYSRKEESAARKRRRQAAQQKEQQRDQHDGHQDVYPGTIGKALAQLRKEGHVITETMSVRKIFALITGRWPGCRATVDAVRQWRIRQRRRRQRQQMQEQMHRARERDLLPTA
jgi:hypothetical protein